MVESAKGPTVVNLNSGQINAVGGAVISDVHAFMQGTISGSGIQLPNNNKIFYTPIYVTEDEAKLKLALDDIREKAEGYFGIIAETLFDNPHLQEEIMERLQSIKEDVRVIGDKPLSYVVSKAQYGLWQVHVAIAKEQDARKEERRLRRVVV
jgi:hypothetical protein